VLRHWNDGIHELHPHILDAATDSQPKLQCQAPRRRQLLDTLASPRRRGRYA
jgi:hypothetical protein